SSASSCRAELAVATFVVSPERPGPRCVGPDQDSAERNERVTVSFGAEVHYSSREQRDWWSRDPSGKGTSDPTIGRCGAPGCAVSRGGRFADRAIDPEPKLKVLNALAVAVGLAFAATTAAPDDRPATSPD